MLCTLEIDHYYLYEKEKETNIRVGYNDKVLVFWKSRSQMSTFKQDTKKVQVNFINTTENSQ